MNRLPFWALLSVSLASGLTAGSGFAQESKFNEARAHIEKWVETRQLIASRDADWRVERESIGQSIEEGGGCDVEGDQRRQRAAGQSRQVGHGG